MPDQNSFSASFFRFTAIGIDTGLAIVMGRGEGGSDYSKEANILDIFRQRVAIIRGNTAYYSMYQHRSLGQFLNAIKDLRLASATCKETYELNEKLFVIPVGNTFVILESKFLDLSLTMRYPCLQ